MKLTIITTNGTYVTAEDYESTLALWEQIEAGAEIDVSAVLNNRTGARTTFFNAGRVVTIAGPFTEDS